MSSCDAGQMPYKKRLQRTLTQQDETVVLLLKNARTVSDTAEISHGVPADAMIMPVHGHEDTSNEFEIPSTVQAFQCKDANVLTYCSFCRW